MLRLALCHVVGGVLLRGNLVRPKNSPHLIVAVEFFCELVEYEDLIELV